MKKLALLTSKNPQAEKIVSSAVIVSKKSRLSYLKHLKEFRQISTSMVMLLGKRIQKLRSAPPNIFDLHLNFDEIFDIKTLVILLEIVKEMSLEFPELSTKIHREKIHRFSVKPTKYFVIPRNPF
jgi:hypothetical protein